MVEPQGAEHGIEVHLAVNPVVLRMIPNPPAPRLALSRGSTLQDLLERIGLAGRSSRLLLSLNDRVVVDRAALLGDGDRVAIMPVLGGG
jgi:sulfur carrier protein ThiS